MAITLNRYLNQEHIEAFERVGAQKLTQGVNIKLNEKIYNVKVMEVTLKNNRKEDVEHLGCRIHSDVVLVTECFWNPTKASRQLSAMIQVSSTKSTLSDYLAQMKQKLRPQGAPVKV